MDFLRKCGLWGRGCLTLCSLACLVSDLYAQRWEAVEWRKDEEQGHFYLKAFKGTEIVLRRGDARRRVPSFNQEDFPEPESGCGPTAVLNWMLWLEALGCFGAPELRQEDAAQVRETFLEIDQAIRSMREEVSIRRNGSNRAQIAAAMDRLARDWSDGTVRMAIRSYETPLKMVDLLNFIKGQRAGILIGQVIEDRAGGEPGEFHALNLVAVDRGGGLMVNNWGERVYGSLRTYPDGQYFFPENTEQTGLKIIEALCMVPVRVTDERTQSQDSTGESKIY